jgi:hypothetical protein
MGGELRAGWGAKHFVERQLRNENVYPSISDAPLKISFEVRASADPLCGDLSKQKKTYR